MNLPTVLSRIHNDYSLSFICWYNGDIRVLLETSNRGTLLSCDVLGGLRFAVLQDVYNRGTRDFFSRPGIRSETTTRETNTLTFQMSMNPSRNHAQRSLVVLARAEL